VGFGWCRSGGPPGFEENLLRPEYPMSVEFDSFRRLSEALSRPYYSVVSSIHGKIFLHEAIETETFEHLCREIAGGHYEGPLAVLEHQIKLGATQDRSKEVAEFLARHFEQSRTKPPAHLRGFMNYYEVECAV